MNVNDNGAREKNAACEKCLITRRMQHVRKKQTRKMQCEKNHKKNKTRKMWHEKITIM